MDGLFAQVFPLVFATMNYIQFFQSIINISSSVTLLCASSQSYNATFSSVLVP